MLKNKFKIIALFMVIILILAIPIVRAVDGETAENPEATTQDNNEQQAQQEANVKNNLKTSDLYLTGDEITIDYVVDGNLFVIANKVTINSQVGGDAFICANTVTVGEQGYIFSNLFTFSENVEIKGVVYDLYVASQNTTITGYIYRDVHIASNTVNIFGSIGRNAFLNCANLDFTQEIPSDSEENPTTISQGMVSGNLTYSAKQEFSIPKSAVSGETTFNQESSYSGANIQNYLMSLGTFLVTVIVIWLLCLWLAPKFIPNTTSLLTTKKVLPVIGFGILTPIVAIIASVALLMLGITSSIGILLLVALFILLAISTSIFVITINKMVCDKFKIQKNIGIFGILIVCSAVLWLIGLIPYLGLFVRIVAMIIGLGIILSSLLLKEKTENTNKKDEKSKEQ